MLSAPCGPPRLGDRAMSAWLATNRLDAAGNGATDGPSCTVIRFNGRARTMWQQSASAIGVAGAWDRATLLVQLQPAALFRFLSHRHAAPQDRAARTQHVEEASLSLLRHVLTGAWPCGHATDVFPSPRQSRRRYLAFQAQSAMSAEPQARHALDDLARALSTSPFHLAHVFRSEIGVSLHQYLVQLRLVRALEQLREGARDLSKLALDLGFSHHSHFSAQFRRAIGHSPRDARVMLAD